METQQAIRELADAIQKLAALPNTPGHHVHTLALGNILADLQGAMAALGVQSLHVDDNAITVARRAIGGAA